MCKEFGSRMATNSEHVLQVSYIILGSNALTGSLLEAWGNLSHLTQLDLSDNSLRGTLPPSWGSLSQVKSTSLKFLLYAFHCQLCMSTRHCLEATQARCWHQQSLVGCIAISVQPDYSWSCNACVTCRQRLTDCKATSQDYSTVSDVLDH